MHGVIASLERDSQSKMLRLSVKISLRFFTFFILNQAFVTSMIGNRLIIINGYIITLCGCVLLFILNRCYSRLIGSVTLNTRCHRQFRALQSIKKARTFSQNFFTFFYVFLRFLKIL